MKQNKHTATLLRIAPDKVSILAGKKIVATCYLNDPDAVQDETEQEANAAFIIECCNNYRSPRRPRQIDRQKISDAIKSLNDTNAISEGFAIANLIGDYDALQARNAELEKALFRALSEWMNIHELTEVCAFPNHWVNQARAALAKKDPVNG